MDAQKEQPLDTETASGNKMLLIADYGRSGQGWLSYMLCYILNAQYLEPYCLLRGLVFSGHRNIVESVQGNLPGRAKTKYSHVVKTHEIPDPYFSLTDKIILLARDPRDVAVSAHNRSNVSLKTGTDVETEARKLSESMTNVLSPKGREALQNVKSFSLKQVLVGVRDYAISLKFFSYLNTALRWNRFYKAWGNIGSHKVTYEQLSTNPQGALKEILRYLEINASDALIDEAVEKFSFFNSYGRKRGQEDKSALEARKGIVKDYLNHFSPIHYKIFESICGDTGRVWGYDFAIPQTSSSLPKPDGI